MPRGATTINLPDTVGYATPDEIRDVLRRASSARVPNADQAVFSAHCHDDLGLAVANSLAAIQGGVRQVECTINGIGERAGNASLEELVMALRVRQDRLPYDTGDSQSPALFETSQLLSQLTSEPVQANKAIVGRNAFAHEAGIHQDGVLKDARTYEIMRPRGRRPAGRRGSCSAATRAATPCRARCEALGFTLTHGELDQVYHAVISLGEHRKAIGDGDLRRIVDRVRTPALRRRTGPAAGARRSGRLRTRRLATRIADCRLRSA